MSIAFIHACLTHLSRSVIGWSPRRPFFRAASSQGSAGPAAEEVEQLREEIISLVSHELRTPLSHIKGYASTLLLEGAHWDETEQRDFIEAIDRQADRIAGLIDTVLETARLSSLGPDCLERQAIAPVKLINLVVRNAQQELGKHPVSVSVPADLPSVLAEPELAGRVLSNLLDNASKYSEDLRPIRIEAYREGNDVVFSVHDQGIGLTADDQEHLFERFYRSPRAKFLAPGLGLGLATCRQIVQAHGGRLWVESPVDRETDLGSVFCFTLPVTPVKGEGKQSV